MNLGKQHEIISELKTKEAEIIRQMQRTPKQFDQSKLKISIECPEPSGIAAGMNFTIDNFLVMGSVPTWNWNCFSVTVYVPTWNWN